MEAGETPVPGSFIARLLEDLDDPEGLEAFRITNEEERSRGRGNQEQPREELWARFVKDVNTPLLNLKLEDYFFLELNNV